MFQFAEVYLAYLECRQNKRNKIEALRFEVNAEENLVRLVEELNDRSYRPSASACFYIDKPKPREIFAASFRDRIIHHMIYRQLSPKWERIFISQSFACRPGKGTHKAAQVLQTYLRKATLSGKRNVFYLKMDIKNYFMSINKSLLFQLLCQRGLSDDYRWLLETTIFHDPTEKYEMRSPLHLRKKVPPHKSLFFTAKNCGLPIGNLTSQFFGNVYLNELDQFVKHILKCHFYVRYMDDFIMISEDKARLLLCQSRIATFLKEKLLLQVNQEATQLDFVFNGVDFVGFIVRPFYALCRRRVVGNCKSALRGFQKKLVVEDKFKIIYKYEAKLLEQLLEKMNSYLSHFRHASTKRMVSKMFGEFNFLNNYFTLTPQKLIRRYKSPKDIRSLRDQVWYYSWKFSPYLVLMQIGCYYESFGKSARRLGRILGYKIKDHWRGIKKGCGFHKKILGRVCFRLTEKKIPYVIINQIDKYAGRTLERLPCKRIEFKA